VGPCLGSYGGSRVEGQFLMSEVPLYCVGVAAAVPREDAQSVEEGRGREEGPYLRPIDWCITQH